MNLKNLIKRALTGIVFVAVIIVAICWHPYSFLALFCLITGMLLWEFYGLMEPYNKAYIKRSIGTLGGVYLFVATFLFVRGVSSEAVFYPYLLFLLYLLIAELYEKDSNPIHNWTYTIFAQLYCAGTISLVNFLSSEITIIDRTIHTPLFVLTIFVFIWLNDTGAYLIGTLFGKHRLFERISPKKSWEGFCGGLVVALLLSQLFYHFAPEYSRIQWGGLAFVVVIFGTWGDLIESLFKRTLQIKDSGTCFPGHGGMLDRFDSLIMAIPAAYIYIELFIRN